jgi:hypothetical protein
MNGTKLDTEAAGFVDFRFWIFDLRLKDRRRRLALVGVQINNRKSKIENPQSGRRALQ